ncbi:MAG TPA: fasciclin domain-containing protein [Chitinophagaceae bacterium]|nr:fasciclin domain-containing protein [Chitinophagaceae bacterium]HPH30671.1 fasciclin domain-containing protein [Chitinophagaceae bacterium]HPN58717.1 fasciclin domain-containing protein [Chitinophagaceae bacterium]
MSNITELVAADKNLSTLLRGVKAADMETELSQKGPFTVFAPSESAFGKLPQGELPFLLKPENKIILKTLLDSHIIPGKTAFKDFRDGQKLTTISGRELEVKVLNGSVSINGATILGRDQDATNGIIHSLDIVIPAD